MLFAVTSIASFIYYVKISQAREEYENARDIIKGITNGFTRQISRLAATISNFESDASNAHKVAAKAIEASNIAIEVSKSGVTSGKHLLNS